MRFKLSAGLLSLATAACAVAPLFAQDSQPKQDDQRVIEDFVVTRGATFGERPKPPKKPPTATSGNSGPQKTLGKSGATGVASTGKGKGKGAGAPKGASGPAKGAGETASAGVEKNDAGGASASNDAGESGDASVVDASTEATAIGLGYTILLAGAGGSSTVVDPSREFVAGDKIRVAFETNADGYLYIFNAENDRDPLMLFPHPELDGGANRIAAHARDFFPADLRYSFEFDDKAATEHIYFIFSRSPLPGVPAGEELLKFCGAQTGDCYWKPVPDQWERIKAAAAAGGRVVESRNTDLAKTLPPIPPRSRGIKLKKDEPAPAVVRMNASAGSDVLLTKIELVHK